MMCHGALSIPRVTAATLTYVEDLFSFILNFYSSSLMEILPECKIC